MARHPRRAKTGNYFHVIVQGIEKKYIFEKIKYKNKYYESITRKAAEHNVKILAYCIMDNHAHFLVYTENIEQLSMCMRKANTFFAQLYNHNEKRVGYVFRDRYVSEVIKDERQLYMCMAYIHFNPVNAGIVKNLNQYFYSSYNDFLYEKNIVNPEIITCLFGDAQNYLEMFNSIHATFAEYKIPKEVEKISDFEYVRKEKDEEKLKEMCKTLKEKGVSVRKISEKLQISKSKVERILK